MDLLDTDGLSVLHRLACLGHGSVSEDSQLTLVDAVVRCGADVDQRDWYGNTAVQLAACHGHWSVVERLMRQGARASQADARGHNLLHRLAAAPVSDCGSAGTLEPRQVERLTKLMLKAGLDFSARVGGRQGGFTPLQIAARVEGWSTVEIFLEHGADPTMSDPDGFSALHRMAMVRWKARVSHPVCSHLLAQQSLADAWEYSQRSRLARQLVRLIALLQRRGLDIDCPDRRGNSAVLLALETNVGVLLKPLFWVFLHCGARLHPAEVARLSEAKKRSILHSLAVVREDLLPIPIVQQLVEVLGESYRTESRGLFLSAITEAFKRSVQLHNLPMAQALVTCGAELGKDVVVDLTSNGYRNVTFLKRKFRAFLSFVLARGADPNLRMVCPQSDDSFTPLHYFITMIQVRARYAEWDVGDILLVLKALLSHGADPLVLVRSRSVLCSLLGICWPLAASSAVLLPVLRLLFEAGVSTHQPRLSVVGTQSRSSAGGWKLSCHSTWTRFAVRCHHPPRPLLHSQERCPLRMTLNHEVAEVLIRGGVCTNGEAFRWRQNLESLPDGKVPAEMRSVHNALTSTVPSLMSLARLALSHAIGCGPHRQHFLQRRDVPDRVKSYVQFEDLFVSEQTRL